MKLSVDIVTPFFLPSFGGIELATLNLSMALKAYCKVRIHTFNWLPGESYDKLGLNLSKGFPEKEIINGVEIYRYPISNLPVLKSFSLPLIKGVVSSNGDILHIQGFCRFFNIYLINKVIKDRSIILTTHGLHEGIQKIDKAPFNKLLRTVINTQVLKRLDHVICLSNADKEKLSTLGYPREKITIIPNGVDEKKFLHREHFVEESKKFKVLCVARFDRNKGYEILVQALKRVRKRFDFHAYFVGYVEDVSYLSYIKHLVEEEGLSNNIRFGISINDSQLADCYLSSDLFVLPSLVETSPLTILEAMYVGLPVIVTRVGGISEIVHNDINGYVVDAGDSIQLSERIIDLINNPEKRREMSIANKRKARNYTWDKIATKTFRLYQRLLSE